ncbi:MAG: GNAT family N-acetyltransferase [Bacteroidetes bacterium]|nr:GNAT family N-acetyltransferase [Bacteroidota bacterium]
MTSFEFQPTLENEFVRIRPLQKSDFETLYSIASDPLIWEQHPNKDRYKKDVFETFFKGAMESGGAFLVLDTQTNEPIGSSRYYELDAEAGSVAIGYTFLAKDHWGGVYNPALKSLMLNHAFKFVDKVVLHIGAFNVRSQKAAERLGAKKIVEIEMEYYGEANKLNFLYHIDKKEWYSRQ